MTNYLNDLFGNPLFVYALIVIALVVSVSTLILKAVKANKAAKCFPSDPQKVKDFVAERLSPETLFEGEGYLPVKKSPLVKYPDQYGRWKVTFKDGSTKSVMGNLRVWSETNTRPVKEFKKLA